MRDLRSVFVKPQETLERPAALRRLDREQGHAAGRDVRRVGEPLERRAPVPAFTPDYQLAVAVIGAHTQLGLEFRVRQAGWVRWRAEYPALVRGAPYRPGLVVLGAVLAGMLVALGRVVRSPMALRQEAPGFLEEMVETLIAAVYGLSSAAHGGLDVLTREEFCAPPVRGLGVFFGHDGWSLSDALGSCAGFVAARPHDGTRRSLAGEAATRLGV